MVSDAKDSEPLRKMPRVSNNNHLRDHISASQLTSIASYIITNSETSYRAIIQTSCATRECAVMLPSPVFLRFLFQGLRVFATFHLTTTSPHQLAQRLHYHYGIHGQSGRVYEFIAS
jgi:hypothetical protein